MAVEFQYGGKPGRPWHGGVDVVHLDNNGWQHGRIVVDFVHLDDIGRSGPDTGATTSSTEKHPRK